jgi:hypothetical protein
MGENNTFSGNSATVHGVGIDNFATATVRDSTFTANSAGSGNGGLDNEPGALLTQFDNQFINDLHPTSSPDGRGLPVTPCSLTGTEARGMWSATSPSRW